MRRLCAWVLSIIVASGAAWAADDDDKAKWYDKLDFEGDFRLRYEGFRWKDHFDDGDRHRLRFRLRFGVTTRLENRMGRVVGRDDGGAQRGEDPGCGALTAADASGQHCPAGHGA